MLPNTMPQAATESDETQMLMPGSPGSPGLDLDEAANAVRRCASGNDVEEIPSSTLREIGMGDKEWTSTTMSSEQVAQTVT